MQTSKSITIYDIAKRAGISASTVGAVMNGSWQARRISKSRAEEIKRLAKEMGYSVNLQASALRKERSKIIGMIVPMHDNRYFSSISQIFERHARERGLFPIVSSTLRDPEIEEQAVRLLLNHQVERVVCTGASAPDAITRLCAKRGVKTFNLDLPGAASPSVISDNYAGARLLTEELLAKVKGRKTALPELLFIGGRANDHNSIERIRGFKDAIKATQFIVPEDNILTCGYAAEKAENTFAQYMAKTNALPDAIFVNSTISLEGILNWFRKNGLGQLDEFALGCFDWDPFAAMVNPDIIMVRQDVENMVSTLFSIMYDEEVEKDMLVQIPPTIIRPKS